MPYSQMARLIAAAARAASTRRPERSSPDKAGRSHTRRGELLSHYTHAVSVADRQGKNQPTVTKARSSFAGACATCGIAGS